MEFGPGFWLFRKFYYQLWYRSTPSTFCDPFAAYNLPTAREDPWLGTGPDRGARRVRDPAGPLRRGAAARRPLPGQKEVAL
jgi:hypothetical protein